MTIGEGKRLLCLFTAPPCAKDEGRSLHLDIVEIWDINIYGFFICVFFAQFTATMCQCFDAI